MGLEQQLAAFKADFAQAAAAGRHTLYEAKIAHQEATYVIAPDCRVARASIDVDYRNRGSLDHPNGPEVTTVRVTLTVISTVPGGEVLSGHVDAKVLGRLKIPSLKETQ